MSTADELNAREMPSLRLASLGFRAVSAIAAGVTAMGAIWTGIVSPGRNLLQFLAFGAATLGVVALGVAAIVLWFKRRIILAEGVKFESRPVFTLEERGAARARLIPLGLALLVGSIALFVADHQLTPKISEIRLSDDDTDVVLIVGNHFGTNASRLWGHFEGAAVEEQVARKVAVHGIEILVPSKFSKGSISVRRGPRSSNAVSFTYPGVIYETAVVELIQPATDPIQRIMAQLEPYPEFSYYSGLSDKPTQWPPRVFKDRDDFDGKIRRELSGAALMEVTHWEEQYPAKLTFVGGNADDPQSSLNQSYARLRMLLTENGRDYRRIEGKVGDHAARALRVLEDARRTLTEDLPNRMFILRVSNRSPEDSDNFTAELTIDGGVYDVTVNEEGEKARSQQWSPGRINIDIPRLRPGYSVDVRVWYAYQPVSERVFADAADVEWEMTQGVVVNNLGVSNGLIRRAKDLLRDLKPYHQFNVDPVHGSPTFRRVFDPEPRIAEADSPETIDQSPIEATTAGDSATVTRPSLIGPPPLAGTAGPPPLPGELAELVHIGASKQFEQQNDARDAEIRLTKAMTDVTQSLGKAAQATNGYWLYQRINPTTATYSNVTGSYLVTCDLLGILKSNYPLQTEALAGWAEFKRSGTASIQSIALQKARYPVVMQFFSDSRDTRKDSKRVLTRELSLADIFDDQRARAGKFNQLAPEFSDLLQYTRQRLVGRYHRPFTLNDTTERQKPFYLVIRESEVNENFYLPDDWMPEAEKSMARKIPDRILASRTATLFDYGQHSRELSPTELSEIFRSN